ncbi:MAG: 4Fe-4S dicluster domain-containing protein [Clostridia bacterium]|nr:4Fe-4S dicluster domain-containing protein [Clostridia bacterium]
MNLLDAIEYSGFSVTKGTGCKTGVCGRCATAYRIGDKGELKVCLACQKQVENGMKIATFPSFPFKKTPYDFKGVTSVSDIFPELDTCIECGLCTRNCPIGIDVKDCVSALKNGDIKTSADNSFECVMCGACQSVCPVNIRIFEALELSRRMNGRMLGEKYGF